MSPKNRTIAILGFYAVGKLNYNLFDGWLLFCSTSPFLFTRSCVNPVHSSQAKAQLLIVSRMIPTKGTDMFQQSSHGTPKSISLKDRLLSWRSWTQLARLVSFLRMGCLVIVKRTISFHNWRVILIYQTFLCSLAFSLGGWGVFCNSIHISGMIKCLRFGFL